MERQWFCYLFIIACQFWKVAFTQSNMQHNSDGYPDQNNIFCDFENGNCFWKSDYSARVSWYNVRGTVSSDSGPEYDFTHFRRDGSFALFNTHVKTGPYSATMSTPPLSTTNENACLIFGYMMYDYEVGGLNVWKYTREKHEKKLLFSIFGPQGTRWYQAFVPIGIGQNFTLEIEGTYRGQRGVGDIALDDTDIRLNAISCRQNTHYEPRFDCDFETNFCSWSPDGDWLGGSRGDGWKSGHLMFRYRTWNQHYPARFVSKTISVFGKGACFTFNYSNDNSFGSRMFLLVYSYGQPLTEGTKIWSPRNVRTSTMAAVTIPAGETIKLAFSVKQHTRYSGSFRLDDFKLSYKGPCTANGLEPEQKTRYECDFDANSTCEWFQRSLPTIGKWKVHHGPTSSQGTGPEKDHTSGDGYFAYLDASRVDVAQLYSPMVDIPSHGACFSFWYHMYGEDINQLTVWRYNHSAFLEDKRKQILWKAEGSKRDNWIQRNITIAEAGDDVLIVMEATRGYFPRGDIAVDDMILSLDGPCYGDSLTPKIVETKTSPIAISPSNTIGVDTTKSPTTISGLLAKTPEIIVAGQINPATVGSTVSLECGDADETVEWAVANQSRRFEGRTSWKGTRVILLYEIEPDDENIFTCKVSKGGQESTHSKPVHITVVKEHRASPRLMSNDKLDPAAIGSKIILQCGSRVDGTTYHWTVIDSNDTISTSTTKSRYVELHPVTSQHDGTYRCAIDKDGFHTAMSNALMINVVKGRFCQSHTDCMGLDGYTGKCVRDRCVCRHEELLRDTKCLVKPPTPIVDVVPPFDVFGVGENLSLRCRTEMPLQEFASYHFLRNGTELTHAVRSDRFYVYNISDASASDIGLYTCLIKYGDVSSEPSSNGYSLQIKEFIDLSCGFDLDLCNWSNEDILKTLLFKSYLNSDEDSLMTSHGNHFLSSGFQGAFLRSPDIMTNSFQACLKFRYRMASQDATSLSVWIYQHSRISDEPATGRNVWEAVGYQGTDWKESSIKVEPQKNFYILFQCQGRVSLDHFQYSIHAVC